MFRYLTAMIVFPEKHCILYHFQGIRHICIGCKLQEAAPHYPEEGFSHVYIACTGTNTQRLTDLLETMFGDLDEPDLEELETKTMKQMHAQATSAEEADIVSAEGAIPKGGITKIMVTSLLVPPEFGLEPEMHPETDPVREISKKYPTKKVTKFYYTCRKCTHFSQNKSNMFTHAHRCLNIKLICPVCEKEFESHDGIKKHINEKHNSKCVVEVGAEKGVTPMVTK